jgi:hypothetical protein
MVKFHLTVLWLLGNSVKLVVHPIDQKPHELLSVLLVVARELGARLRDL